MRSTMCAVLAFAISSPSIAQTGYVTQINTGKPQTANIYSTPAALQQAAPAAPSHAPLAQPVPNAVLQQGTPVHFKTQQELSSKHNRVGDRFELRVAEDVSVDGVTIIPAGSRGVGEVTRIDKKGMFGKSGKLDARVLYVRVGQTNISLTGNSNEAGSGGTAGVVAAAVLFWPVAPFVTGKSAIFPPGTRITGWVENDLPLVLPAAKPTNVLVLN